MDFGFWIELKKPIMVLAPMADVTDAAFRQIIAKYGKPDVMFTEFVSADGLCHPDGQRRLLKDLQYSELERPIVAQLFSARPEKMEEAAALIQRLGFDGLDINMGCPDRNVEKQGAGAALIKNPRLAREVIRAARRGAPRLPLSVKTRLGYNKDELEIWLPELLAEELVAVTIHARTRKEMSKVPARWERVAEAVAIRDRLGSGTLILGNGDVPDLEDAGKKAEQTGADGIMLGRAIFGNPWLFAGGKRLNPKSPKRLDLEEPTTENKLLVLVEHTKLFEKLFVGHKNFSVMKKHFKAYLDGFPAGAGRDGARGLRVKLMETENTSEVEKIIKEFLESI